MPRNYRPLGERLFIILCASALLLLVLLIWMFQSGLTTEGLIR